MFLFPVKMFSGQLKPAQAFMSGKLKISGNMGQVILFSGSLHIPIDMLLLET